MSDFETLLKEVGAIVATEHDKGELSFRVPGDFDILVLKIVTKVNDLFTPAPCNLTHTEPFDFAQCETHDTTFPLGGTCKFNGREIWEVYADEADEQRQRAVKLEMRLEYLEQTLTDEGNQVQPSTQYREGVRDGLYRAATTVARASK